MKKKQEHLTEYLTGYVRPDGVFVRNMWRDKTRDLHQAIRDAREYTAHGNETLAGFGVDAMLKPAVVKREVWYDESEPEVVA